MGPWTLLQMSKIKMMKLRVMVPNLVGKETVFFDAKCISAIDQFDKPKNIWLLDSPKFNSISRSISRSRSFVGAIKKRRFHGDQVLINVPSSSTVLELKKLLAAEISGDLRTEVFSENIHASLGSGSVL